MTEALDKAFGIFSPVYVRTFLYVVVASSISLVLGYAIAYFVARHTSRREAGLLLILLISPFWISYLMRMLAWINLLQPEGYVNRVLTFLRITPEPIGWLEGRPITVIFGLVYGYIPYMILPLYAFLDRIDQNVLEAGRDLGERVSTFFRVTLPLSRPGILASLVIVSLPMFGDYFTNTMLSGSPNTTMIGNLIDDSINTTGQQAEAAVLILVLMVILIVPIWYYLRTTAKAAEAR